MLWIQPLSPKNVALPCTTSFDPIYQTFTFFHFSLSNHLCLTDAISVGLTLKTYQLPFLLRLHVLTTQSSVDVYVPPIKASGIR
jgi:hypothetical protein